MSKHFNTTIIVQDVSVDQDESNVEEVDILDSSNSTELPLKIHRPYTFQQRRLKEEAFSISDDLFGKIFGGMTKSLFSKFNDEFGHFFETGT